MRQYTPNEYIKKLQNNQLSEDDKKRFADWLRHADNVEVQDIIEKIGLYYENLQDESFIPLSLNNSIEQRIDKLRTVRIHALIRRGLTVAAAITIIFFGYYISIKPVVKVRTNISSAVKIIPGSNKAVLTLGNGKSIVLNDEKNGLLASQGKIRVVKTGNGRIVYAAVDPKADVADAFTYNTISTPRGGQYRLELSDGSKVWLNAGSSFRYPVRFGSGDRRVQLTGEAYFEVAKDKAHPFKVTVNNMEVKVLGTHFNIMAYADEAAVRTTLLEGSVMVTQGANQRVMVPGEQAVISGGINIIQVNANEAIEWKNGNFGFTHEQLPVIMRKIGRWYNVDIAYEGKPTGLNFVGTIPRSQNISEVLKYLELTGLVHFKINERRVIVMP